MTSAWAVVLQRVTLELDWRLLLQREWTFRSAQAQAAELWLGVTDAPSAKPSAQPVAFVEGADLADLDDWLKALLFRGRTGAVVDSIRIAKLHARGPVVAAPGPVFELDCLAEGRYARGRLEWKLSGGTFRGGGQEAWTLDSLSGAGEPGRVASGNGASPVRRWGVGNHGDTRCPRENRHGDLRRESGDADPHGRNGRFSRPIQRAGDRTERDALCPFPELHQFRFEGALQGEKAPDWALPAFSSC